MPLHYIKVPGLPCGKHINKTISVGVKPWNDNLVPAGIKKHLIFSVNVSAHSYNMITATCPMKRKLAHRSPESASSSDW